MSTEDDGLLFELGSEKCFMPKEELYKLITAASLQLMGKDKKMVVISSKKEKPKLVLTLIN